MPKNKKGFTPIQTILFFLAGTVVLAGVAIGNLYFSKSPESSRGTACTAEAKICPDGTAVGRTGPNCKFAACPTKQPVQGRCGDDMCNAAEKANPNLCPRDCAGEQSTSGAKTFYVSNAGDDANDGLTPKTAWKTISKVNALQYAGKDTNNALGGTDPKNLYKGSTLVAGTRVLFSRGDVWREKLFILSSGTREYPIVFGAYGDGPTPIITGFECLSAKCGAPHNKWTKAHGSIHSITLEKSTRGKEAIFYGKKYTKDGVSEDSGVVTEDGKYLTFVPFDPKNPSDYSKMEAGSFLFNYKTNTLYVWTLSGDAPDSHAIEVAVRDIVIKAKASEFFTIKDLEVSGGAAGCVDLENAHHAVVSDIHIHSCGGAWQERFYLGNGMTIYHNSGNVVVENSKIHDVYDSAISPQIFYFNGQLIQNITIRNNDLYNAPLSVVEVTSFAKNSAFRNIVIENNRIYRTGVVFSQKHQTNRLIGGPGVLVLIDPVSTGSRADDVYIKNNKISGMLLDAIAIGFTAGTAHVSGNTIKDNTGAGILVYDDRADAHTRAEIKDNKITNNGADILYDARTGDVLLSGNTMRGNGTIDLVAQVRKYMK